MKKRNSIFGLLLSAGLIVAGATALSMHSNHIFVKAQGNQQEFTNYGQFTYQIGAGAGTLMSAEEVATEGVISSGYEGSVLKVSGANTYVSFDFATSSLKAKNVMSVTFKLFASDPTSALTQCDFRVRKSSTQTTVVNEGAAGHSLLDVRNSWFTYELSSSKFYGGASFESLADDNGYLHFETLFRTSASFDVYIDSVIIETNFVKDDSLIKNSDFVLFTPSDYFGGSNDTWHFFTTIGGTPMLDSLNFGIQYNLTLTEAQLAGYQTLRFGTSLTGNDYTELLINYKVNTYLNRFNGVVGNIPSSIANISVSEGTHTYEFYSIKDSDSTVRFVFGIDGVKIFKTDSLDATGAHCQHIALHVGNTGATASAYSPCATTASTALNRFGVRKLSSQEVPFTDNTETNACETKYYEAKTFYNKYLTTNQKAAFATENEYADLRARFAAWAAHNGETITFNASGATFSALNRFSLIANNNNTGSTFAIIVAIIATISLAGLLIITKGKKKD